MENALDIIGKSPADLAELMGISNAPAKSTSALAEIKQVHQNVMGTKEVDGEAMEVAIVKAGAFSVTSFVLSAFQLNGYTGSRSGSNAFGTAG